MACGWIWGPLCLTIPARGRREAAPWLSQEVIGLSDGGAPAGGGRAEEWSAVWNHLRWVQQGAGRDRGCHIGKLCRELEGRSRSGSGGGLFGSAGDLTGESTARLAVVGDGGGGVLAEGEEMGDGWRRYCGGLCASREAGGVPDGADEDSCGDGPDVLLSEVANAIRHLGSGKSPGPGGVPAGLIGCAGESGAGVVQHLCGGIWRTGDGLLVGKIRLSLRFPGGVMSVSARTAEQLH